MEFVFRYTQKAWNDLERIDHKMAQRIVLKLREYGGYENPLKFAKKLSGELAGLYRFRIGEYRVIFRKTSENTLIILIVLRIKHRKDIYK